MGRNNSVAPVTDRPGGSAAGGRLDHSRIVDDKVQASEQVFARDRLIFEQDTHGQGVCGVPGPLLHGCGGSSAPGYRQGGRGIATLMRGWRVRAPAVGVRPRIHAGGKPRQGGQAPCGQKRRNPWP